MNYRVIIRFSIDGDPRTREALINATRKELEELNFQKIGTGSYEAANLPAGDVTDFMEIVEKISNCHQNSGGLISADHVWLYLDTPS